MSQSPVNSIPRYYLYGERLEDVELDFLHIEPIRERSGRHDWTISPHAHPDHVQILLLEEGSGELGIEGRSLPLSAPCLFVIPALMVHEIRFQQDTDGIVITAATAYARAMAHGDARLLQVLQQPAVYPLADSGMTIDGVVDAFHSMSREYIWSAQGRRPAIMAHFIRVLVSLMRLRNETDARHFDTGDRDHDIVQGFRELMEQHFRSQRYLNFYVLRLGVTPQRLNKACKSRGDKTASDMLHERILIEAKRCLIYTRMSVAEVAFEIGFNDPAYFNRFFSSRVGVSPGHYRQNESER